MSGATPPLWDHQREALRNLKQEFASQTRATNIMACGTGKTRVGAELAQQVSPSEPVLIVVPTLDLVAQTLGAWAEGVGRERLGQIVAVCGDKEVMDRDVVDDLAGLNVTVTSDPGRLADLLREQRDGRSTVAITYQSLQKLVAAHQVRGMKPWKLVVVDEAHRSAGLKNRQWSVIHDDTLIPASKRLYMTATPRLVSVRDDDLSEVVSMDDAKVFGRVAHRLSFAEARERKLLANYRVIVSVVTDEEMHRLATDRDGATFLQVGRSAVSAPMLAGQVAVLRAAREFNVQRMLTYHRRVADARWFSQTLPGADALLGPGGTLTTGFVHGSQKRAERRQELAKLADDSLDRVVISNARVLSEGYDAPTVGGVAFINARKSTIDTVQAVGRALRLGGQRDKTAYIFVPVLLEPGQDPEKALQGSAYADVWQVVRALAAHDEALGAELGVRRRELGTRSHRHSGSLDLAELPEWLQLAGVPVPAGFARAITVQAVRSTTTSWEEHLGAAAAYSAEHGNLLVRSDFVTEAGHPLGMWIRRVRQLRTEDKLSATRVEQLDAIGMVWDVPDERFQRRLDAAAKYRAEYGNLRVPKGYETPGPDPIPLGQWIIGLRPRRDELSSWQREALDELGMVWAVFAEDWKRGITAARAYREREGNLRVPVHHVEETQDDSQDFALGEWLARRRENRKKLSAEKAAELTALGMVWKAHEDAWQRNFEAARAYRERNGNLNVPMLHIEPGSGGVNLRSWLDRQRADLEAGRLNAERAAAFESLSVKLVGVSERSERAWKNAITLARKYHQQFGHLRVPQLETITDTEGKEFRIGKWIAKMRRIRDNLTAERVAELDTLGMVWSAGEPVWQQHFAAAEKFYRDRGHLKIHSKYVTDPPEELRLGSWLDRQKRTFKQGKLSLQRVKKLTDIGMQWPS